MQITDEEFSAITRRIHAETGIVIGDAKRSLLVARLSSRLDALRLPDFGAYARLLDSPDGGDERRALVSAITTNVTRFFREPHHFEALAAMAPHLLEKARSGTRIRIWSAGCSTGQEAFSIAATLLEHAPGIDQCDTRILATDIDPHVIETARQGRYDARQIGPETPDYFRRFVRTQADGTVKAMQNLAGLIRFEVLNLMDPWPFSGKFDIVFCRNVVIYFDPETRQRLWRRIAERIVPGGTLFIGHSERMDQDLATLYEPAGITRYRRTANDGTGDTRARGQPLETAGTGACHSEIH